MANVIFIEPGTDATGNFGLWDSQINGSRISSDTANKKTGPRSIQFNVDSTLFPITLQKDGLIAPASGRRVSFWLRLNDTFDNDVSIKLNGSGTAWPGFAIFIKGNAGGNGNKLSVKTIPSGTTDPVERAATTTTLQVGTWYRVCLAFSYTSSSVNEARLYLNGIEEISISNVDLTTQSGKLHLRFGHVAPIATADDEKKWNLDDVYVDDGVTVSPSSYPDTGDIRVTAKKPNAHNSNQFDTAIGANPSNRWTNVNEVPASDTNGWQHNAATVAEESYTLESRSQGDVDITGKDVLARMPWVRGKVSATANSFVSVGNANNKTAGTSLTISVANATTAGKALFLAFVMDDDGSSPGTISVTDSKSNSWVKDVDQSSGGTGTGARVALFSCLNPAALTTSDTISVSHPNVTARAARVMMYKAVLSDPALDKTAKASGTGTSVSSGDTSETSQAKELVIGVAGWEGVTGDFSSGGTGMNPVGSSEGTVGTSGGGAASNVALCFLHTKQRAVNTQQAAATLGTSRDWSAAVATYKYESIDATEIVDNGNEIPFDFTTTVAYHSQVVNNTTYPDAAAGIGLKSAGELADTFLYECGTVIAYKEATIFNESVSLAFAGNFP